MERTVIRPATASDAAAVLDLSRELVADGTVYPLSADMTDEELRGYWYAPRGHLYVAEVEGQIAGLYLIRPNQPGRGSHVANGSYAVGARFRGRGLGEALGLHSLEEARRLGFKAMQFNLVVATNTAAVALWRKLGFQTLGRLPQAFAHAKEGLVDAYVMHRFL
jgi:L-amino acid N-acyltransferase YncA